MEQQKTLKSKAEIIEALAVHWQSDVYSVNKAGAPELVRTSDDASKVVDVWTTRHCGLSVRKLQSQRMITGLVSMTISFRISS